MPRTREKSRDPRAPLVRRSPPPPPDAPRCSFCGSQDHAEDEVWRSTMGSECIICTDCATLATMFFRKDEGGDDADAGA